MRFSPLCTVVGAKYIFPCEIYKKEKIQIIKIPADKALIFPFTMTSENDFIANAIYIIKIAVKIVFKYLPLPARLVASPPGMENRYIPSMPI